MELFNYCNNFVNKPCIYFITNKINNKMYVGKTINFLKRHYHHKNSFINRGRQHNSPHLHAAIMKYGYKNFDISILEFCDINDLSFRELYWINFFKTDNPKFGYNLRKDVNFRMITHPSTSKKISERLKKEWDSGLRKDHSIKLKQNWKNNEIRKKEQSLIMSKNLTKYNYNLYFLDGSFFKTVKYSELKELNLSNCVSTFHEKKINKIIFKEYIIERNKIS